MIGCCGCGSVGLGNVECFSLGAPNKKHRGLCYFFTMFDLLVDFCRSNKNMRLNYVLLEKCLAVHETFLCCLWICLRPTPSNAPVIFFFQLSENTYHRGGKLKNILEGWNQETAKQRNLTFFPIANCCQEEVLMSDRLLREAHSSLQKWKAELTKRRCRCEFFVFSRAGKIGSPLKANVTMEKNNRLKMYSISYWKLGDFPAYHVSFPGCKPDFWTIKSTLYIGFVYGFVRVFFFLHWPSCGIFVLFFSLPPELWFARCFHASFRLYMKGRFQRSSVILGGTVLSCSPLGTSRLSQAKGAAADEIRKLNKNSQEHHKKAGTVWGKA